MVIMIRAIDKNQGLVGADPAAINNEIQIQNSEQQTFDYRCRLNYLCCSLEPCLRIFDLSDFAKVAIIPKIIFFVNEKDKGNKNIGY